MNKLPRVFANPIDKKMNNTQDLFRSSNTYELNYNPKDINKKINQIFADTSHVYKSRVKITLKDGEIDAEIVGKTNLNLLTLDGKLIKITDILDIKKI